MADKGNQIANSNGVNGPLPDELRHFNWGAFLLSWVWAVNNKVWIGLIILVISLLSMISSVSSIFSLLAFVGSLILGFKGNRLAWRYRKFENLDQFKLVQKAWARWGVIIFVLVFVATLALVFYAMPNLEGALDSPVPQVT